MKKSFLILLLAVFAIGSVKAGGDIVGKWRTIDDNTGEIKSIVEISEKDGKLYGTVVSLINKDPNYDPICNECKDHLKEQKIKGMQIINGLTLEEGKWTGEKGILDPDNGKYYTCKLWIDEKNSDQLNVRGYISFLYRTQTWFREK
jgi:uncharacterized protein (DUF2147 family)